MPERRNTKEVCAFRFGRPMKPCPSCGSYNIGYQTPIKMQEEVTEEDDARSIIRKWARATQAGNTLLKGPVYLHCRDCFHKGPAMDCTGRTSEDVGQDPVVADTVKNLWNSEKNTI